MLYHYNKVRKWGQIPLSGSGLASSTRCQMHVFYLRPRDMARVEREERRIQSRKPLYEEVVLSTLRHIEASLLRKDYQLKVLESKVDTLTGSTQPKQEKRARQHAADRISSFASTRIPFHWNTIPFRPPQLQKKLQTLNQWQLYDESSLCYSFPQAPSPEKVFFALPLYRFCLGKEPILHANHLNCRQV